MSRSEPRPGIPLPISRAAFATILEGADPLVADLFALFHDARRWNDGGDREHGARGAALARVGITPDPRRLCTDAARDPEVLTWATLRGAREEVSAYVEADWLRP
ncbi:MAG TPA: hypothetical protein VLH75_06290 [Longimicrobiales bacterium]|nr:hypothetical protein [Longimicrobiales bacterium]